MRDVESEVVGRLDAEAGLAPVAPLRVVAVDTVLSASDIARLRRESGGEHTGWCCQCAT